MPWSNMKRRLTKILMILSWLLCVAFVLLWVRSGFWEDSVHRDCARLRLYSGGGNIRVESDMPKLPSSAYAPSVSCWRWELWCRGTSSWLPRWKWAWPRWYKSYYSSPSVHEGHVPARLPTPSSSGPPDRYYGVLLPYWLLALPWVPLPAMRLRVWWLERMKAMRRHKAGLCQKCRYDLRASPERCPECGPPRKEETA